MNAPRFPWSGKSDQDLESPPECRAASDLIWKIALPPPCPEICAAINKGAKSAQQNFLPRCFNFFISLPDRTAEAQEQTATQLSGLMVLHLSDALIFL